MRMKRDRLDAPDPRPFHSAILFARKSLTGLLSLAVHLRKHCGVEVALVKRSFTSPNNRGDDSRKRFQASHRADRIRMLARNVPYLQSQLRRCGQGIASLFHGRRARVRFLSVERDAVALASLCA